MYTHNVNIREFWTGPVLRCVCYLAQSRLIRAESREFSVLQESVLKCKTVILALCPLLIVKVDVRTLGKERCEQEKVSLLNLRTNVQHSNCYYNLDVSN